MQMNCSECACFPTESRPSDGGLVSAAVLILRRPNISRVGTIFFRRMPMWALNS